MTVKRKNKHPMKCPRCGNGKCGKDRKGNKFCSICGWSEKAARAAKRRAKNASKKGK